MLRPIAFVALTVIACAKPNDTVTTPPAVAPEPDPPAEPPTPPSAAEDLARIEAALVEHDLRLRFDIEASGALQARLVGEVRTNGALLSLRARGTFAGQGVELELSGDGERLTGTNGSAKLDVAQPPELEDAIVVGLTRMGILHNLALLASGRPPDHGEGGVREWVQATDPLAEARITPDGLTPEVAKRSPAAMSFGVVVAGNAAGEATLWWDRETNLPVERHQIVRFATGEMHVRETYSEIE